MAEDKKIDINIQKEAIELVKQNKTNWEDATAFVTDKVAFQMRNLIRELRKLAWGIFNSPIDPVTGRKKIKVPLIESIIDTTVKNADLDAKDINFRANNPSAVGFTAIVRSYVKKCLDNMQFGMKLDDLIRRTATDGTAVWKIVETKDEKTGKKVAKILPVDLLNFYIEPTADSIQETEAVIERALLTKSEFDKMPGLINKEYAKTSRVLSSNDTEMDSGNTERAADVIEVFEYWGLMPEYLITGNKSDKKDIEGHIIVSGTDNHWELHLTEKNTKGYKPYEEAWWTKMPGRWYGRGVAEKLMMLQLWLDTIVNIRINRSYVSQLGIFKVRKGSGLSAQTFSRLASNGILMVNSMDDIEQMVMQEASQASYKDEENITDWARYVTSSFEVVTGEAMPSSTTATTSSIMSTAAKSLYKIIKDNIGFTIERVIKNHVLPIEIKNLEPGSVMRIMGSQESIDELKEYIANSLVYTDIENGKVKSRNNVESRKREILDKLDTLDGAVYIKLLDKIDFSNYDMYIDITNEKMDYAVMQQRLIEALKVAPEYKDVLLPTIFDLAGIPYPQSKAKKVQEQINRQTQLQSQTPNPNPAGSLQEVVTEANTLQQ